MSVHSTFHSSSTTFRTALLMVGATLALAAMMLQPAEANAAKVLTIDSAPIEGTHSLAEIEKRIKAASSKRGWVAKTVAPGHITATILVRTHMAKVDIKFDTKAYSISYRDSTNLKYKEGRIHRAYNTWVMNLNNDIQLEMSF